MGCRDISSLKSIVVCVRHRYTRDYGVEVAVVIAQGVWKPLQSIIALVVR
jgi:hypothetical protein